ncbi:GDSL esterase/lipase At3g48460-like [Tasmannia lanceolata]|uniref:GDSL esterase/lipase At3g48460-like n=1 Tax=Tasmannia lanceolata TaxID=3420 RepID=UPI004063CD0A
MARCSSLPLYLTLFYFFLSFSPSLSLPQSAYKGKFSKIYSFGDSLTDTGNCLELLPYLYPPYGMTTFGKPSGRWSDGRLVLDFLAEQLSLPYVPAFRGPNAAFSSHGVNFAVAGSTAIDYEFYEKNNLKNPYTVVPVKESLQTQHSWFNEFIANVDCAGKCPAECKAIMEGALFWVGTMGGNDYAIIKGSSVVSPLTLREMAVANVIHLVQDLLAKGAKYVIVQGPAWRANTSDINTHNELLQQQLDQVRKQNPNATILFIDFLRALFDNIKNAKKNGFQEPSKICCGTETYGCGWPGSTVCSDPSKYIRWDGSHSTEAMNAIFADQFFHQGYTQPPFDSLFAI